MDLEKSMQFVLEQQAQFWATLQKLGEAHAVLEADQKRLAANQLELARLQSQQQEMIGGLTMAVGELVQAQKRTEQRVQDLAESQQRTDQTIRELAEAQQRTDQTIRELAEAQQRTDQTIRGLAEAQQRTDQSLNALIKVVNDLIRRDGRRR